jgi:hypothetical protein
VELLVMSEITCEPLVATEPLNAPDAVQLDALVDDQVSVELPPLATLLGLAVKDTVGGLTVTDTVVELWAVPPAPVHVRTNLVVAFSATVVWVPLVGSLPVQPFDAVQDVALVEDQVSVDVLPMSTVEGFAEIVTTGAGGVTVTVADCEALPPAPVHDSVYVVLEVSAPVDTLPFSGSPPDHPPPDPLHEVALVVTQVMVDALPLSIVLGVAVIVTVGAGALTETVADCEALPPGPVHVNV